MADELDGVNSGARNIGRFFFSLIPWALAIGVATWFGTYVSIHKGLNEVSQERRAATYVDANPAPKSKLKIEIIPFSSTIFKTGCVHITAVDDDGDKLLLYGHNDCGRRLGYVEWHWELVSPNGTVLKQGEDNGVDCVSPTMPGDMAECSPYDYETDDRASALRVWTETSRY